MPFSVLKVMLGLAFVFGLFWKFSRERHSARASFVTVCAFMNINHQTVYILTCVFRLKEVACFLGTGGERRKSSFFSKCSVTHINSARSLICCFYLFVLYGRAELFYKIKIPKSFSTLKACRGTFNPEKITIWRRLHCCRNYKSLSPTQFFLHFFFDRESRQWSCSFRDVARPRRGENFQHFDFYRLITRTTFFSSFFGGFVTVCFAKKKGDPKKTSTMLFLNW